MKVNEKARNELLQEVEGLTDSIINQKPAENKWSIRQILEHLTIIESTFTKLIERQLESGEDVHPKDQPVDMTVDRSYKVDAPEFSVPGEEFKTLKELKDALDASHQKLTELYQATTMEQLEAKGIPHPAFGHLNLKQAVEFIGYHEWRHIEQLKEIKESLGIVKKN